MLPPSDNVRFQRSYGLYDGHYISMHTLCVLVQTLMREIRLVLAFARSSWHYFTRHVFGNDVSFDVTTCTTTFTFVEKHIQIHWIRSVVPSSRIRLTRFQLFYLTRDGQIPFFRVTTLFLIFLITSVFFICKIHFCWVKVVHMHCNTDTVFDYWRNLFSLFFSLMRNR